MFSYTVLNYKFYTDLAYKQQVGEIQVPVTRGTLYSAPNSTMENGTVFSTSVDLNDLAIDPQIEWSKQRLAVFLTDVLYKEMCYLTSYNDCYDDMLRFLRVLEIPDFDASEEAIKEKILERVQTKISKNKVDSVRLRESLTAEQQAEVLSWNILWVYPNDSWLYVNPEEILQKDYFAQQYMNMFWGNKEDIIHAIRQRDLRYIPIYQKLSLLGSDELQQYIDEEKIALKQGVLEKEESIGGFIILSPHPQRIYPERSIGSQIVGFLDNSWVWHYGIEWYFQELLKWNPGEQVGKKDIRWRTIDTSWFWDDDKWAEEWADIHTSIDRNIQKR